MAETGRPSIDSCAANAALRLYVRIMKYEQTNRNSPRTGTAAPTRRGPPAPGRKPDAGGPHPRRGSFLPVPVAAAGRTRSGGFGPPAAPAPASAVVPRTTGRTGNLVGPRRRRPRLA